MTNPAYFIIDVTITDPEGMKPYHAKVAETLEAYGGKPIVAGGKIEALEGNAPLGRVIIVKFDSMEKAHAWHKSFEYQAIISYRLAAAESHAYLVEGMPV